MMHNNPLQNRIDQSKIHDENYGRLGISKLNATSISNSESIDYLAVGARRANNRSAMIIGSTIQNNSQINKTTTQPPRKTEERIYTIHDGEKTQKLDMN